jgi:hypothetical protein
MNRNPYIIPAIVLSVAIVLSAFKLSSGLVQLGNKIESASHTAYISGNLNYSAAGNAIPVELSAQGTGLQLTISPNGGVFKTSMEAP